MAEKRFPWLRDVVLIVFGIVVDRTVTWKVPSLIPFLPYAWWLVLVFLTRELISKTRLRKFLRSAYARFEGWRRVVAYLLVFAISGALGCLYWYGINRVLRQRVPQSLTLEAITSRAEYPSGTTIGQIPWSSKFRELRLQVVNTSSVYDISNLDIVIQPDQPVAEIGQVTSELGVSFSPTVNPFFSMERVKAGKRTAVPLRLIATTCGYRIHINELATTRRIEIVMAIANLTPAQKGDGNLDNVFDRDYWVRNGVNLLQGGQCDNWYGHGSDADGRIEVVFIDDPTMPTQLTANGKYFIQGEEFPASLTLPVRDMIGDAIPAIQKELRSK